MAEEVRRVHGVLAAQGHRQPALQIGRLPREFSTQGFREVVLNTGCDGPGVGHDSNSMDNDNLSRVIVLIKVTDGFVVYGAARNPVSTMV